MKQSELSNVLFHKIWVLFFCLAGLTTISAFNLSSPPSSAQANAESHTSDVSVVVPASCTMTGLVAQGMEHAVTMNSYDYKSDIGETLFSVTCNDNSGYSVYAIGFGGDVDGNTNLLGASTNAIIPTGTVIDKSVSNWAMKLTAVPGNDEPTILSDTNGSFSSYHVVPSTATKVVTYGNSTGASQTSQFKSTYSVATSTSLPPDTYSGQVKYTLVHPHNAEADGSVYYNITFRTINANGVYWNGEYYADGDTVTISSNEIANPYAIWGSYDARYAFSSWSKTAGSFGNQGFQNTTYNVTGDAVITLTGQYVNTEMQNLAAENCTSTRTPVYDTRDNSVYWIQRLADGTCWMLDNLGLKVTDSSVLASMTEQNTNATSTSLNYFKGIVSRDPINDPSGRYATSGVSANWSEGSYSDPLVNVARRSWVLWPQGSYTGQHGAYGVGQGKYGGYYNYCAATAGSYCYGNGLNDAGSPEVGVSATEDICPSGWSMPGGTTIFKFQTLCDAVLGSTCQMSGVPSSGGQLMDASDPNSLQFVLSTPLSGLYFQGSYGDISNEGYIWSNVYSSSVGTSYLRYNASRVLRYDSHRYFGLSIRCYLK